MDDSPSSPEEHLPFRFRPKQVPGEKTTESWRQIESRLATATTTLRKRITTYALGVLGVAAIIALGWWLREATRSDMTEIRTAYGEIRRVVLPDSSVVFMNANSVLRMAKQWAPETSRSVWLEGEAYFEIQKSPYSRMTALLYIPARQMCRCWARSSTSTSCRTGPPFP